MWQPVLLLDCNTNLCKWRQVRWRGALHTQGDLLVHTAWPDLLQLVPLVPGLKLLRHDLPGHQPDGVVRVLPQWGRSHQPGVRRRWLQGSPRVRNSLLKLSLLRAVRDRRGGQEALPHVWVLRGEGVFFWHGLHVAGAGLRVGGVCVWFGEAGETFLLCSKVKSIRRRAELWDLSGSPARRADVRGGRVLGAAVLRAGLVWVQGRVLWRTHHEVSQTAPLWQPGSPSTVLCAEVVQVNRSLTFGKSGEKHHEKLWNSKLLNVGWSTGHDFLV